jgi:hypothetical protein
MTEDQVISAAGKVEELLQELGIWYVKSTRVKEGLDCIVFDEISLKVQTKPTKLLANKQNKVKI